MRMSVEQLCALQRRTEEAQKSLRALDHILNSSKELHTAVFSKGKVPDDTTLTDGTLSGLMPLFETYRDIVASIMNSTEVEIGGKQAR